MLIKSLVFKKHRERNVRLSFLGAVKTFDVSKMFGVIVLSSASLFGAGVFGNSNFASESIVVSGVSWLNFPNPKIRGTSSILIASKNEGLVTWGVVVALGSLSGVAGKIFLAELAGDGNVGDNWMPQRLAKLSRAFWAPSWFSTSGTQSQSYLKLLCLIRQCCKVLRPTRLQLLCRY